MKIVGIICEYNPFHLGHKKQIDRVRSLLGEETAIVCLMSGNFVQRGKPAILDKSLRAQAALANGADLVLELPVPYALSSAEGFALGGVKILSSFCDYLCFGTENGTPETLMDAARTLLSAEFREKLLAALETGISFPAAREAALGDQAALLRCPNDILAVEYCKAILALGCPTKPLPIRREGDYHAQTPDAENPSASSLRNRMLRSEDWQSFVPGNTVLLLKNSVLHDFSAGERAVLSQLRRMTDAEFEALPYASEGLWRKLMHAAREKATIEEILEATKSKRYTRTRLDRMVMCAYLGINQADISREIPYIRVLGLSEKGMEVLKIAREHGQFLHAGEKSEDPYWRTEQRWDDLYGLFAIPAPDAAGAEKKRRMVIQK